MSMTLGSLITDGENVDKSDDEGRGDEGNPAQKPLIYKEKDPSP